MSRLVIDSSVAVKWFVPEVGSDIAGQVLERRRLGAELDRAGDRTDLGHSSGPK